ncbi:sugar phosphate isomerase/epimerase family protein [Zavarzinia sp.]|uniref:sugar phosphate isomerase/epimerase family protein n=1 Tax=Zavarzinia sp. TaxID=2027920 RepID=UPI003BB49D55
MPELSVYQALWATEQRTPGVPETPVGERFDAVKAAGYEGMAIDLGALTLEQAKETVPHFARTGLGGLLTAFPKSIEDLRPALHLAKDIGAPFVVVVGQVMPVSVDGMIPVIRDWLRLAAEEGVPLQFETHRNCITNDMFATLQLLDAIPEMRLAADLSHYVVGREMTFPLYAEYHGQIRRLLARSDSFQGRIASRCQVQLPVQFPQTRPWLDLFLGWWAEGFRLWKQRAGADDRLIFLCELGPRDYAITGADGLELSDRAEDALILRDHARRLFAEA